MKPWWEALFSHTRPGSRTVLCDPDIAMVIEFARRGHRILVVHQGSFDVPLLRRQMRETGLASQLMGSQPYSPDTAPSLVQDFYELWVFADQASPLLWQAARLSLKKGATIFWLAQNEIKPPWGEIIESLPESLAGVRTQGFQGMDTMGSNLCRGETF